MTTQAKRDQSYMRPTSQGEQVDNFLSLEGSTLGDYQLEHKLGTGGMAVVYLARQISLRRKVALKILKPHLAETGQYVERFQNEAQSAASLNHANIVQIHEVGMRDNYHFIAQEYVAGPNLKQLIESQAEVSYDLIVSILQQTVSALCKAEEEGIVHRDIKPENILITSRGEIKVADFGLARIAENNNKELTQVGVTMGTPLYMSPEQVEGKPLDSRSDLYSLGVTCYYLLTRKNPFDGESPLAVAVKHLQHTPPQLANLRPDLPKRLCQLIHKMLAKQIDQRPTTAEIFEELQQLQQEHPIVPLSQTPSSITTPFAAFHSEPLSATRQLQRSLAGQTTSTYPSRFALILSGLFLLGAIGIGLFLATSSRPGDPLALAPGKVPGIEKLATAKQQFDAAFWNPNREEAYKSILDYFPEDGTAQTTLYRLRAKHELAEYYLRNGPADLAKRYYTELTMANEQEWPEYPAIGYCRLVLIYHGENNTEKTLQYLPKAETLQGKLTDVDLQRALEDVINDHRNQRDGGG